MSKLVLSGDTSGSVTIESPAVSGTTILTLPTTTDTLVGKTTTDTLTNKTLTSPVIAGTPTGVGVLTSGTSVASTSGTSIDFTSIPSWVKRITVELAGVSLSGSANLLLQLGAGSVTSSGYISTGSSTANGGTPAIGTSTSGFYQRVASAAYVLHGTIIFTLVGSNQWVASGNYITSGTATICTSGGSVTLSGTLDRVRITTSNGTDTFDAGSINILFE